MLRFALRRLALSLVTLLLLITAVFFLTWLKVNDGARFREPGEGLLDLLLDFLLGNLWFYAFFPASLAAMPLARFFAAIALSGIFELFILYAFPLLLAGLYFIIF